MLIEEPDPKSSDVKAGSNLEETIIRSNSNIHTLCKEPSPAVIEEPNLNSKMVSKSIIAIAIRLLVPSVVGVIVKSPIVGDHTLTSDMAKIVYISSLYKWRATLTSQAGFAKLNLI